MNWGNQATILYILPLIQHTKREQSIKKSIVIWFEKNLKGPSVLSIQQVEGTACWRIHKPREPSIKKPIVIWFEKSFKGPSVLFSQQVQGTACWHIYKSTTTLMFDAQEVEIQMISMPQLGEKDYNFLHSGSKLFIFQFYFIAHICWSLILKLGCFCNFNIKVMNLCMLIPLGSIQFFLIFSSKT